MFVFALSAKKDLKKVVFFLIIFIVVIVTIVFVLFRHKSQSNTVNYDGGSYNTKVESINDIPNFLEQFGWKIMTQPIEVTNITIPSEFNDVYESYNHIQKQQGLDLSSYKGTKCKKYCFKILNYPNNDDVIATLIIYDGNVIGGDISETLMGGFIKKFTMFKKIT